MNYRLCHLLFLRRHRRRRRRRGHSLKVVSVNVSFVIQIFHYAQTTSLQCADTYIVFVAYCNGGIHPQRVRFVVRSCMSRTRKPTRWPQKAVMILVSEKHLKKCFGIWNGGRMFRFSLQKI